MRSLLISLQSEFYKSRKTLAFWAAILLPLIICSMISVGFINKAHKFANVGSEALWINFAGMSLQVMGMLILPFYVIFMAFSINNIEHKNDTWKTLFTQPLNKLSIYAAKYLYGVIIIFLCLFLFAFFTYLFGHMLSLLSSDLKFGGSSPVSMLSKAYSRLFITSLGLFSFQFILSLIWADFLKPMGVGFVLVIIGIITAAKWSYAVFIPHAHPILIMINSTPGDGSFTKAMGASLIYSVVFFIIGYFIVAKKSIK